MCVSVLMSRSVTILQEMQKLTGRATSKQKKSVTYCEFWYNFRGGGGPGKFLINLSLRGYPEIKQYRIGWKRVPKDCLKIMAMGGNNKDCAI